MLQDDSTFVIQDFLDFLDGHGWLQTGIRTRQGLHEIEKQAVREPRRAAGKKSGQKAASAADRRRPAFQRRWRKIVSGALYWPAGTLAAMPTDAVKPEVIVALCGRHTAASKGRADGLPDARPLRRVATRAFA